MNSRAIPLFTALLCLTFLLAPHALGADPSELPPLPSVKTFVSTFQSQTEATMTQRPMLEITFLSTQEWNPATPATLPAAPTVHQASPLAANQNASASTQAPDRSTKTVHRSRLWTWTTNYILRHDLIAQSTDPTAPPAMSVEYSSDVQGFQTNFFTTTLPHDDGSSTEVFQTAGKLNLSKLSFPILPKEHLLLLQGINATRMERTNWGQFHNVAKLTSTITNMPLSTGWSLYVSLDHQNFPLVVENYDAKGTVISRSTATPMLLEPLGWVVGAALREDFGPNGVTRRAEWTQFHYKTIKSLDVVELPPIEVGNNVNEYRFENSFAYTMGPKPPTHDELIAMSKDKSAVRRYQDAWTRPPPQPPVGIPAASPRPRYKVYLDVLLLVIAVVTIGWGWRQRAKSA